MRAVLGRRVRQIIETHSEHAAFFAPDIAFSAEAYETRRSAALARIEMRDPDDWPILATAMALDCPVWTEDNDFFGTGVPTWTSDRVALYLNDEE